MSKNICAVHVAWDSELKSCLSFEALQRIARAYNRKVGKPLITFENVSKKQLWKTIRHEMNDECKDREGEDTEICWIKKSGTDPDIIYDYFKPEKPKGKFAWLSNVDIEKLMVGQQKKHSPYFKFYGPVPSDFDQIITELNGSNLNLMPAVRKVGLITNLDPHYRSGSHWTAFYLDLDDKSIEYFDSVGKPPYKTMKEYINNLKAWLKINKKMDTSIKINKKRFQKNYDGDCGIWSSWYIIQRLNGRSFEDIVNMDFAEEKLNKCRDVYFRKTL